MTSRCEIAYEAKMYDATWTPIGMLLLIHLLLMYYIHVPIYEHF